MGWASNYATARELASFVRIGDLVDDPVLDLALGTASRAIDRETGRQFGKVDVPTARYYTARWDARDGRWEIPIDDLMSTVGLVVDADRADDQTYGSSLTAFVLDPVNAAADGKPWTRLLVRRSAIVVPTGAADAVRITARWGWSGVPDPIRQACLLQASRLLSRRDSPFGVAGSPEAGSELRLLAKLDADVKVAVRPFRRVWGAV